MNPPPERSSGSDTGSERGAINACRALLERHGLVVHEVDARADYGRDLLVDLTENGEITGAVAGIQVKGDRRFFRDNATWVLSASPKDARFWADSSIPVVGVLWDRHAGNLSPRHTAPRWTLPAVHGRPTPWTRAATSPPLVGCSAGNSLLAVDRRTKRNPESRETRPSDPVSPRLPGGSDHTPTGSGAKCDR